MSIRRIYGSTHIHLLLCFSDHDLRDFVEGRDRKPYEKLGAIPLTHQGISGVCFVVWAPSAKSVHLVGDFNSWNPVTLPMRSLGSSGCRELFVPFAKIGDKYKYRVLGADGVMREKLILLHFDSNRLLEMPPSFMIENRW